MKKFKTEMVQQGSSNEKTALLATAKAERVDNGIAMVMDVLGLCGLTLASLAATKKDVSQLMDSIKNHDVKPLEILPVVLDVVGLVPFNGASAKPCVCKQFDIDLESSIRSIIFAPSKR